MSTTCIVEIILLETAVINMMLPLLHCHCQAVVRPSLDVYCFGDTINFLIWVALNNYSCVWSGQRVVWLEWYLAHVLELKRIISPHVWSCWLLSVAESEVEWKLLCMDVLLVYLRLTIAFQWLLFRSPGQRSVKCLLPMDLKETAT